MTESPALPEPAATTAVPEGLALGARIRGYREMRGLSLREIGRAHV